MPKCYIVGAGEFTARGLTPAEGDFVIAADGGFSSLRGCGITPDLLMGDFDSLGEPLPTSVPVERFPVRKDDTDMGIALAHGWSLGYRDFALYGGSGGRVDHLLANLQSMCRYSRMGASVRLVARDYDAYALTDGELTLPPRPEGTLVSVFCHGERAEGVGIEGLSYMLDEATLSGDVPLGVSNQHIAGDVPARVRVRKGTLIVVQFLQPEPAR